MYDQMLQQVFSVFLQQLKELPISFFILIILSNILSIAFSVLLAIAINNDCKARGIKSKTVWVVLTLFFSPLVPIIYACARNSLKTNLPRTCLTCGAFVTQADFKYCPACNSAALQPIEPEDAPKKIKLSKILAIVAVICYVASYIVSFAYTSTFSDFMSNVYSELGIVDDFDDYLFEDTDDALHYGYTLDDGSVVYYDMKGNAYNEAEDVLYYDLKGNIYEYDGDGSMFDYHFEDAAGNDLDAYKCYVDENGYFYYDTNDEMTVDDNFDFKDKEGRLYYDAVQVSWNANGELVDLYGSNLPYETTLFG